MLPPVPNEEGASATVTLAPSGAIDTTNPFFQPQGNGRSCATCHDQQAGWSITPDTLAKRFKDSDGLDPVFRTNDGAVSPNAPVATTAERERAYAMLLSKGLIRVGLPIPAGAEFELLSVDDPYHFATAAELSLFRRPLPTTNLQQPAVHHQGCQWPQRRARKARAARHLHLLPLDAQCRHPLGAAPDEHRRRSRGAPHPRPAPLYTLRNLASGETVKTSDPGAALQTGKWRDLGKLKIPSLRGLESRSPYFHDGSENDVAQLVRFYDRRFEIGLSQPEVDDLANFLRAL